MGFDSTQGGAIMQNCYVTIPAEGAPIVNPEDEAVISGHRVAWHVESFNPDIHSVLIAFEAAGEETPFYFEPFDSDNGEADGPSCRKDLTLRKGGANPPCSVAMIYGEAPSPGAGKARRDKYWVKGLDANKKMLVEVDPKIVTSDP
jgi:hypothetical protein